MINEETVSARLRILRGWCRGIRQGTFIFDESRAVAMEAMLAECVTDVEQLELVTGKADIVTQLREAGSNVVMLNAVLKNAPKRTGGRP